MIVHDVAQNTPEWRALRSGIPTASEFGRIEPDGRGEFLLSVLRAANQHFEARAIAEALGVKKSSVDGALNALFEDGLMDKAKQGRSNIWTLTEEGGVALSDPVRFSGLPKGADTYIAELIAERCCGPDPEFETYWTRRGKELEPEARDCAALVLDTDIRQVGFVTTDCGRFGCSPDGLIDGAGVEIKCMAPKNHVAALLADEVPAEYLAQVHGSMIICEVPEWWFIGYCPGLRPLIKRVTADDRTRRLEAAVWAFVDRLEAAYRDVVSG